MKVNSVMSVQYFQFFGNRNNSEDFEDNENKWINISLEALNSSQTQIIGDFENNKMTIKCPSVQNQNF